jgi:oligopeptide transport system substrate-binding protein
MAKKLTRREFLTLSSITAGAAILAACSTPTPEVQVQTQVVEQTKMVESTKLVSETKIVEQTKVVEKVITATPVPAIKTIQGRELPADAATIAKQIYREAGAEPKFFDTARDIYSGGGINMISEPLLRNNEFIETVPALAESWKAGPNAEYWEFVIRKGAVWSDGKPVTADDIVYTYKHMSDPKLGNPWIWFYYDIKGVAAFNQGKAGPEGIGVKKIDDRTVQIYGEFGSIPYLPALLSYQAANIVPKHKAEADPEHWADKIEGLLSYGPYLVTKWDHNKVIEYELNPKYNGPHKPGIAKVVNPILAAGAAEFTPWLNKETELVHILGPAELAAARADPKLNPLIHFFNNFQSTYIALDTIKPPLDKKEVRQALAHAIDRATMCSSALNGTYGPGYSMLPPGFPAYNPDLKSEQVFDLEKAKQLLKDGGVTNPKSVTIELFSNGRDVFCEFVKQQWETNLGITVKLTQLEGGVWGQKRADHAMQAYRGPYEYDYVDPSNMLTGLFRSIPAPKDKAEPWGSPRHPWKNDAFDKLLTDAGKEADVAKRIKMYQDAEKILCSEVGVIFLAHQIVFQIWWPWLVGMHPDKTGNVIFRWLDIARFQMYIHKDVDTMMKNA